MIQEPEEKELTERERDLLRRLDDVETVRRGELRDHQRKQEEMLYQTGRRSAQLTGVALFFIGVFVLVNIALRVIFGGPDAEIRYTAQAVNSALLRVENAEQMILALREELSALGDGSDLGDAVAFAQVEGRLSALEQSLSVIHESVVASPERAMSVPILRSDVDRLSERVSNETLLLRRDVDRIDSTLWTFNFTLIGLLATALGLNLASPLIAEFLRRRKRTAEGGASDAG